MILVKKRVYGKCYLQIKIKAFLLVAEWSKMLFVISGTSPRYGLKNPLQSELCFHEQRVQELALPLSQISQALTLPGPNPARIIFLQSQRVCEGTAQII